MSMTWVIANQKGGVGKTTTVVSLAGVGAARGLKVLAVDLDPHGSLSSYLGVEAEHDSGLTEVFRLAAEGREHPLDGAVRPTHVPNLDVIPAGMSLATIERRFGQKPGMGLVVDQALAGLRERYDRILVDCPPVLGMLLVNGIATADQVVVPVQTDPLALVGLERLDQTLAMMARGRGGARPRMIVPTMFDRRTRASWDTLVKLKTGWRDDLWWEVIPVDTQLRESSRRRMPVTLLGAPSRAGAAYERLFDDLGECRQASPPHGTFAAVG